MNTIEFYKMVASGNDFLVIDNRKNIIRDPKKFAGDVCRPHLGVGGDGVLLLEPSSRADFFMRIVNADGSEAEACGNGYRCVALFAHKILGAPKKLKFETLSGMIETELVSSFKKGDRQVINAVYDDCFAACPLFDDEARVRAKMANPSEYRERISVPLNDRVLNAAFINTGVPHVVIFADKLNDIAVTELGRAVRNHKQFAPRGTNVNFVQATGPNSVSVRTYERGVEEETLACGTGAAAAAVVGVLTGRVAPPVQVKTKGGEALTVHLKQSGANIQDVFLEGNAEFVFEGRLFV